MGTQTEIRLPKFPECWDVCGNCGQGEVLIDDVLAFPGDHVERDDTLIVLETGKVALDIPSPYSGTLIELHVSPGDSVGENALIATIQVDD